MIFGGTLWCVLGDFYSTCSSTERVGVGAASSFSEGADCLEFSNFISQMEVIDLSLLDLKFTWYRPNGETCIRIDRILIFSEW